MVISTLGMLFLLAGGIGAYFWRVSHDKHSIAKIEAVWQEQRPRSGIMTVAELSFIRTTRKGEAVACRGTFDIGQPSDGYKVGDKLEIVPRAGSCTKAFILGRAGKS